MMVFALPRTKVNFSVSHMQYYTKIHICTYAARTHARTYPINVGVCVFEYLVERAS